MLALSAAACHAAQDLRFDYALFGCPCYVSTNCFCQEHFDHLNWVSPNGHYLQTTTDNQLTKVTTNGNKLAAYWNDLNTGWTYTSATQQADDIHAWVMNNFAVQPGWITLNEISAGTWPGNQAYRTWVIDVVSRLKNTYGYNVVVFSPFANPGANGADWQLLTQNCYIGIENYLSGAEVKAQNFSVAWCQAQYVSSRTSYTNLGVPAGKLMLTEHFSHTVAGTGWGRSGVSYNDWDRAIIVRMTALRNANFPGVLTYAWRGNGMAIPVEDMIHFEDTYAAQSLPGKAGLPASYTWTGGNGAYGTAANWTPARTTPSTADVLVFDGSISGQSAPTVTISGNDTISQLRFIQNVNVTFNPTASSVLTLQSTGTLGSANEALQLEAGTRVTLAGTTPSAPIVLALGATSFGYVDGDVWFNNGDGTIYNRIASLQAGGLVFRASGKCYVGGAAAISAGGCFGQNGGPAATTSVQNGVVFNAGAEYHHQMRPDGTRASFAYAFPHALTAPASMVQWDAGSNFILWSNNSAAFANRSFADLTFRSNQLVSITAPTSMDNVNVENNGTATQLNVNFQGSNASVINGDLTVASDAGGFRLAATAARTISVAGNVNIGAAGKIANSNSNDTLALNGTAAQVADFAGSTIQKLQINNSAGVSLASDVVVSSLLDLASGELITSGSTLTAPDLAGVTRAAGFVRGTLTRDIGSAAGLRSFPVGTANAYSPVDINFTSGSVTAGKLAITVTAADHPGSLTPTKSANRYWTLSPTTLGSFVADLTFTYRDADIAGITESALRIGRNTGGSTWQMFTPNPLNAAANTATATGVTGFSDWTLGESSAFVPAGIAGWELY